MADYVQKLRDDLVEQFKGKPVIDALMEAVGDELNEVRQFYEDLRDKRNIQTAVGKQLDGIGDNAVLTRLEAGALACAKESVYVLDDDAYRTYLIYKIWKNTNNCTYYDIIRAFKMFWDKPLHYREDPAIPATMIFETDDLTPEADVSKLLNAPFIKAAIRQRPCRRSKPAKHSSTPCCRFRLHRTSRRQNCLNLRRMSYELLWLCCY